MELCLVFNCCDMSWLVIIIILHLKKMNDLLNTLQNKLVPSWRHQLEGEFEKPYFKDLIQFVDNEYSEYTCYPGKNDIFAAFDYCDFNDVKVVSLSWS